MASSLMASHGVLLRTYPLFPPKLLKPVTHASQFLEQKSLSLPFRPVSLRLRNSQTPGIRALASSSSVSPSPAAPAQSQELPIASLFEGPNRIIATFISVSFAFSTLFAKLIQNICPDLIAQIAQIRNTPVGIFHTVGPLFFAASKERPASYLNTPMTVVAAGLAKWLDIYSGIMMVRVLLSWFPNIPWDRQPLSALRDLCDPYLSLFRNIIPPVFGSLDVSPLLGFTVLGMIGSILKGAGGVR